MFGPDNFVQLQVLTPRTRGNQKAAIPALEDPVSRIETMGKETVNKLANLPAAAKKEGVELNLPEVLRR